MRGPMWRFVAVGHFRVGGSHAHKLISADVRKTRSGHSVPATEYMKEAVDEI